MNRAITGHDQQCVCNACMAPSARLSRVTPSIAEALAEVRAEPQAIALNQVQRRHLAGFVKNWNADRVARGLAPMLADDALTEGLRALEQMVKQA